MGKNAEICQFPNPFLSVHTCKEIRTCLLIQSTLRNVCIHINGGEKEMKKSSLRNDSQHLQILLKHLFIISNE